VSEIANALCGHFANPSLVLTDVAGVKSSIVSEVSDPRFLGDTRWRDRVAGPGRGQGGPVPGLQLGPHPHRRDESETYSVLHGVLRELGANVVAVSAEDHDRLVALASHVPHLLAGALMNEAAQVAQQDAVLLQLAAGGFRDMTRIAAGDPSIWPDVLFENREAVTDTLVGLEKRLENLRIALADDSRDVLEESLTNAADARRRLPGRFVVGEPGLPARAGQRPTRRTGRGHPRRLGATGEHLRHRDRPRHRGRGGTCCSRSTAPKWPRSTRRWSNSVSRW